MTYARTAGMVAASVAALVVGALFYPFVLWRMQGQRHLGGTHG